MERFGCTDKGRPLFLVLDRHPDDYKMKDPFLLVEWGHWQDLASLRDDVKIFTTFFSKGDFPGLLNRARSGSVLSELKQFATNYGFVELEAGVNLSVLEYP